ncbi:MAG TPA: hypothetical protein VFB81_01855, partial [Myxococcales bacterium]|nr:hypothetical protein [Myxococcales bacterium]
MKRHVPFTASRLWPSLVLCALLAGAGACTCGDPSLLVTVEIAPRAVTTRCVVVAAQAPGIPEDRTGPMLRPPDGGTLAVAVYRDDLPESISVVARGFDDPSCTILNEEAPPRMATFVRGQVVPVLLQLNGSLCLDAGTGTACPGGGKVCRSDHFCVDAGTELDCLDGDDDDGDGRIDCLDVDCLAAACADGCFLSPVCQADGGCRGPPTSCDMPPGLCFQPTGTCSSPGGTCSYAGDTTRGCDDSTACTFNDRCTAAGGCAGTPYTCPPTECSTGSCLGDGGCALVATRAGQPCFGGVCTDAGTCLTFPYPPSNFTPVAIADGGVAGPIVIA